MARQETRNELRLARRIKYWVSAGLLVTGLAFHGYYFATAFQGDTAFRAIAGLLANALVSAALITLIVGKVTEDESRLLVLHTIEDSLETNLSPLRETLQHAGSQTDFRWTCLVSRPPAGDPHQDYLVQDISIARTIDSVPPEVWVVCAASNDDGILQSLAADKRCVLRWLVDGSLNPCDDAVFLLDEMSVNGIPQTVKATETTVLGSQVRVYKARMGKEEQAASPVALRLGFRARKHLGTNERVELKSVLFDTTFGASFECVVSDSIKLRRLSPNTAHVSVLGPRREVVSSPPVSLGMLAKSSVYYESLLGSGSTVSFELEIERGASERPSQQAPAD